ncbi:hypothetical protein MLD38_015850 [Melastoma candidum]|uniref:Uncharacterized protein n=1 Tax=Melastoma candidum TaxID=119954 RepID=A0ACB9RHL4_9MYRT|nr:hypothetical protein MLD38_015850 [Melastoma candidum]
MARRGQRSRLWNGVSAASLALIVLVVFLLCRDGGKMPKEPVIEGADRSWSSFDGSVKSRPTVEYRNGTDLIWQIPGSPKAVLFIAHGCNGRAINFWDRSSSCEGCVGLPEERLIVLEALSRGFAVLTVSSMGRCWTMGEERLVVREIIEWWVVKNGLEMLPVFALGASSGGYFVSALATDLKFGGIVLMIAEGVFDQIDVSGDYPPTLFVHMPKDTRRKQKIDEFMVQLKKKGIDVAEVKCMEFPLSPNFLADRIPGLGNDVSAELFKLFQREGFVDENGYMKKDGRATRWKKALDVDNKGLLLDKRLINHVQEELNLAFAFHEMTSLQSEQIFKWFESHLS